MQVTTVTIVPLSADTAVRRLAFAEVTLHAYVASNIDWPCYSYTEDVERRVAFKQKFVNIEEQGNILNYLEGEAALSC